MATRDYSDLLLNPQDRLLYQKFLRFSEPPGVATGGSNATSPAPTVVNQTIQPNVTPNANLSDIGNLRKARGLPSEITNQDILTKRREFYRPLKWHEYFTGRKDDARTESFDESMSPLEGVIQNRLAGRGVGASTGDIADSLTSFMGNMHYDNDVSIKFLDDNEEIYDLGTLKENLTRGINDAYDQNRPFKVMGISGDPTGDKNYKERMIIVNDLFKKDILNFSLREEGFSTLLGSGLPDFSSGATDMALIMAVNKMLDPGSVVREGEYDRATEIQNVENKIKGVWSKYVDEEGNFMTPESRMNFTLMALEQFIVQKDRYNNMVENINTRALDHGVRGIDVHKDNTDFLINEFKERFKRQEDISPKYVNQIIKYMMMNETPYTKEEAIELFRKTGEYTDFDLEQMIVEEPEEKKE